MLLLLVSASLYPVLISTLFTSTSLFLSCFSVLSVGSMCVRAESGFYLVVCFFGEAEEEDTVERGEGLEEKEEK